MSQSRLTAFIKILVLAAILSVVGWQLHSAWRDVGAAKLRAAIDIDWRWAVFSILGFAGAMLAAATAWYLLLRRMDSGGSPVRLYGAYCFSQMGKYVPGKVMLLLMRLERTGRLGVDHCATTLSTIMENVAYLVSGALIGVLVMTQLVVNGNAEGHLWLLAFSLITALLSLIAVHPGVFYRLVNPVLRRLGRSEIEPDRRLPMQSILAAVAVMGLSWLLGGFALWSSARCLVPMGLEHFWSLTGAFALSVLIGMITFMPGGIGIRELVQGVLLLPMVTLSLPVSGAAQARAKIVVTLLVMLQRLFQIVAEGGLGLLGGSLTAARPAPVGEVQLTD